MGAKNMHNKETCAAGMEQSSSYAEAKDAQIKLSTEECAGDMGHQEGEGNYAAVKDAQNKSSMEECALVMGQRSNYAESMGAQIKFREEDCAGDMGHIAIPRKE